MVNWMRDRVIVRLAAGETMPSHMPIFSSLLVALAATFGTVIIHGVVVHTIIMTLRRNLQRGVFGVRLWANLTFVMGATLLAFAGHLVKIRFGRSRSIYLARSPISAPPSIHRLAATRLRVPTSYCHRNGSCWDHSKRCAEC